jgi:hypothetical protein
MVAAFERYYRNMTAEEGEVDLNSTMNQDQSLQSRGIPSQITAAKQQAFSQVYPDRPLTMHIPATPAPPSLAAAPAPAAPAPGTGAAPAAPRAARPAPATPPPTPQSQAMARFVEYYDRLNDQDLEREARRLQQADPAAMDVRTVLRRQALERVQQGRQRLGAAAPPDVPEPPDSASHAEMLKHYIAQYTHLSSEQLIALQARLVGTGPGQFFMPYTIWSKAVTKSSPEAVRESLRLSAIQQLLNQRQVTAPPRPQSPSRGPRAPHGGPQARPAGQI